MDELAAADIIVMPSLWEGRSILQLEAMAFDLPMIISDVPGLREPFSEAALSDREIYRKTSFGYLVRTNDVEAYRSVLMDYVQNKDTDKEIKRVVRSVSNKNSISQMVATYLMAYREVLD